MSSKRKTVTNTLLTLAFVFVPHFASAQTNTFPSSGNAGVGTTTPATPVEVRVNVGADTPTLRLSNADTNGFGSFLEWYSGYGGGKVTARIRSQASGYNGGFFDFQTRDEGNAALTSRILINNLGNVGIGTATPGAKFEVDGSGVLRVTEGSRIVPTSGVGLELSADSTGSYVGAYNRSTSAYRRLYFYGSPYVFEGGNVGVGVANPAQKLEVAGVISAFDRTNSAIDGQLWASKSNGATTVVLHSNGNSYVTSGNVGIGNSSPTEKLHVTGNISVTGTGNIAAAGTIEAGNIKAKYQDLAEWVPSSEQLSAGTVVVLDTTKSNQVISSAVSYDTRVAGVISAQPGITLGESGEGKVLVATTGRVRVRVDASRGAIQIGDLLVTSDVPGVAMKSEPVEFAGRKMHMPGTIIGKALEPLAKGQGEILVLLSLQ